MLLKRIIYPIAALCLLAACEENGTFDNPSGGIAVNAPVIPEHLLISNEGIWQSDNGQLSFFDGNNNLLFNQWFRTVNGRKLGDTPNDILQVNDTLIAIAVNYSNLIQYIHPDGTDCGATENVPNNRCLCTDGRYLYVTSYAHQCGTQHFEKGYVAKIDIGTKQVVAACQVGWEPEGIALYDGRLYVANSGGYAYAEAHDYESTLSVIDAATMQLLRTIDTGCTNLYGTLSQMGPYLCINAAGNYDDVPARTVVLNCATEQQTVFDFPSTCITTDGNVFYTVGADYSYSAPTGNIQLHTINPRTMAVGDSIICTAISEKIKSLTSPYCLYYSGRSGNLYFTDAGTHASAGYLYGYTEYGLPLFEPQKVHLNPSHIISLPLTTSTGSEPAASSQQVNVVEYHPAPGQFVNLLPEAADGDTHAQLCERATQLLNNGNLVHLGSYGGYITVQFDHPVQNLRGSDFRILGNSFYAANASLYAANDVGGSIEPGIVYVGVGEELEHCQWYELAGSEYYTTEVHDFSITYHKPTFETPSPLNDYIAWEASWSVNGILHDTTGYHPKGPFHTQSYWPLWEEGESLTFSGGRLPNNALDVAGNGTSWILYRYAPDAYGYADASLNDDIYSTFDIDWAVDSVGRKVQLSAINFIRVASGTFQHCGSLGETSTEVAGFEDLHLKEGYDEHPIVIATK